MSRTGAETTGKRRRSGWARLGRVLLYMLGLVVFLSVTAVVTLDIALNRPKVRTAVEGWLHRTTGVEAGYERLAVKLWPVAIVAKGLHAEDTAWGVEVDDVEVRMRVFRKEIEEIVVRGVRAWGQEQQMAETPAEKQPPTEGKPSGEGEEGAGKQPGGIAWGKGFVLRRIRLEDCNVEWRDAQGKTLYALKKVAGDFVGVGVDRPVAGKLGGPVPGGGEWWINLAAGAIAETEGDLMGWPLEIALGVETADLPTTAAQWGGKKAEELVRRALIPVQTGTPGGDSGRQGVGWSLSAMVVGTAHNGFSVTADVVGTQPGKSPIWKVALKGVENLAEGFSGSIEIPAAQWDGNHFSASMGTIAVHPDGTALAKDIAASLCGGSMRVASVEVQQTAQAGELLFAIGGMQGVGIEIAEMLRFANVPDGGLDIGGRLYFSGEASVKLGGTGTDGEAAPGTAVAESLKGHLQGKVQGLHTGVGEGPLVGRVLDILQVAGGTLLKPVLPGLGAAAEEWHKKLDKSGGTVSYEVAEAELTAAGNGTVEVAHAKLGIGGYWLELAGHVGLVEQTLDMTGRWTATGEEALRLVGGDPDKLAWLPGGDNASIYIPLTVTGSFAKLEVRPDYSAILDHWRSSDAVQTKVEKEISRGLEHLHTKDRENVEMGLSILQGLLGK